MWIIIIVFLLMIFPLLIPEPKKKLPKEKMDVSNSASKSNEAYGKREYVGKGSSKSVFGAYSSIYKEPVRIKRTNTKADKTPSVDAYEDWYNFSLSNETISDYKTQNMILKDKM